MRIALILAATALAVPALAQEAAPAKPTAGPSPEIAREAARTAVQTCARMGYKTMATVVDTSGRPVAAVTADPQLTPALADGSVRRAMVAAAFHAPSSDIAQRARLDAAVFYVVHDSPKLSAPEAGGVPLTGPENPKGAIGVAGAADGTKNEACAQAGAAKVAPQLK